MEGTAPTLDLRAPGYRQNPYPTLARIRAENPIHQDAMGVFYITRHADVTAALKDPRLGRDLRKWIGYAMVRPYLADSPLERCIEQWMFSVDAPQHTRLRQLVARVFTPRAVAAMRSAIEQVVDDILADLNTRNATEIEIMSTFAQPFPVRVIASILGLPITIYDDLKRWSTQVAVAFEPTSRRRERQQASDAAVDLMAYLRELVAVRRDQRTGDVVSILLAAAEDGDKLSEDELIAQLVMLFIAGHETTTHLIGNGLLTLCRHPEQMQRLRTDPSLGPRAVEEMLRYEPSVNTIARAAHADTTLGGKPIPAGSIMLCMAGAANRDPDIFPDPDRFDIARTPNPHVTFGGGVHYCLGAPLARLESQVAFGRLLERFVSIEVDEQNVRWRDLVNLRGLEALPVRVTWGA